MPKRLAIEFRASDGNKKCAKCLVVKPVEDFYVHKGACDGRHCQCKACRYQVTKSYVQSKPGKANLRAAGFKRRRSEKGKLQTRLAHLQRDYNKPERVQWEKEYAQLPHVKEANRQKMQKVRSTPQGKITSILRSRMYSVIKRQGGYKAGKMYQLLGCSWEEFQEYFEAKFTADMTWENHGKVWHVDHIKPLVLFDLTKPEEYTAACHYSNLQPLLAKDNLQKGSKYVEPQNQFAGSSKTATTGAVLPIA